MRNPEIIKAIEQIFSLDSKLEDIESGLNIKNIYSPKKIYKFRALSENSINNVLNNNIWFDNPINMNDPYDCRFMWENSADREFISAEQYKHIYANAPEEFDSELFAYISENKVSFNEFLRKIKIQGQPGSLMIDVLNDRHEELISKFMTAYLQKIYFCSFTENFSSMLMWSHYSNNHSGFCIEYDSTKANGYNPYIHQLYPVLYTNKLFNVSELFYDKKDLVKSKKFNNLFLCYPLIYKSDEWDYEKEWRVIHPHGLIGQAKNLSTPPISTILLGSNFFKTLAMQHKKKFPEYKSNHDLALKLIDHCKCNGIKLKIMKHSISTYSMTDTPIDYDECYRLLSIGD